MRSVRVRLSAEPHAEFQQNENGNGNVPERVLAQNDGGRK